MSYLYVITLRNKLGDENTRDLSLMIKADSAGEAVSKAESASQTRDKFGCIDGEFEVITLDRNALTFIE